jgi:hypothetical protein
MKGERLFHYRIYKTNKEHDIGSHLSSHIVENDGNAL